MKLDPQYVIPYLPHKVKMYSLSRGEWQLQPCNIANDCKFDFGSSKPLLVPLSSFTNEQWIEVFMAGIISLKTPYPANSTWEYIIERHDNAVEVLLNSVDSITYDFVEKQFATDCRFNQLAAFNKMYELHGDVEFLIDVGLALNKLYYQLN